MGTVRPRERKRPSERGRITPQQLHWIEARDMVGEIIDRYLAANPEPHARLAAALLEDSLRAGDHAIGLLLP